MEPLRREDAFKPASNVQKEMSSQASMIHQVLMPTRSKIAVLNSFTFRPLFRDVGKNLRGVVEVPLRFVTISLYRRAAWSLCTVHEDADAGRWKWLDAHAQTAQQER